MFSPETGKLVEPGNRVCTITVDGNGLANHIRRSCSGKVAQNKDLSWLRFGNHLCYGILLAHFIILACHKNYILFVTTGLVLAYVDLLNAVERQVSSLRTSFSRHRISPG